MTYVPETAAQTDANSPIDQTLMDLRRTNSADHEARILALEDPSVRFFTHFNQRSGFVVPAVDQILGAGSARTIYRVAGGSFFIRNTASGTGSVEEFFGKEDGSAGNNQHLIRAEAQTNIRCYSMLGLRYSVMSTANALPLRFKARFRQNTANTYNISIGFAFWDETSPDSIADPGTGIAGGIYLSRNSGTGDWRFSAHDGTGFDHGTDFTKTAAGTWFDVEILFEAGPQARCFINGVLKETLGDVKLPKDMVLYGHWTADVPSGSTMDCDRWLVSAGGPLPDLA